MKSWMKKLLLLGSLLLAQTSWGAAQEGRDYHVLNPAQPVAGGKKIEVLEFFFYGCSHCYHLHPALSRWEKAMPKDVELKYVPVVFRDNWEPMASAFYALEAIGQRAAVHDAFFTAWNVDGKSLVSEGDILPIIAKQGVDRAKFSEAYNSFAVASKVNLAKQMLQRYQIRGTPTLIVDGKYHITGLSPEDTLRVLDELIARARKERGGK